MYKNVALNKKEVEKSFEKRVGFGITYHGENDQGRCVLSAKFKNPEIEEEKNKLIERKFTDNPKEVFRHYQFTGYGVSYSVEKITDKGFFKETYRETQSEDDKSNLLEHGGKGQEQEKVQTENSPIQEDKKNQKSEKEINQQNFSHKEDKRPEKETSQQSSLSQNSNKNVYYGIGVVSLVLLLISMAIVWVKKK